MSASTVTKGSAAIKPPSLSLRLATSEASTTTPALRRYLVIIQAKLLYRHRLRQIARFINISAARERSVIREEL